jgi:phosphotransferase system HPr (HPr) family protein
MNGLTLRQKVVIKNPQGFHMRPLTKFVEEARRFHSRVFIYKDDERRDGTSPLELMTLGAEEGTELMLEVIGDDAQAALDVLVRIITSPSPEDLS